MQLDGRGGGTTDYPSLSCAGVLSGGPGQCEERIVTNRSAPGRSDGCIDGSLTVAASGDRMEWSWWGTWQGVRYAASAVLARAAK